MTGGPGALPTTLAIHPNARGFGWAAFTGPLALHDWAVVEVTKDKNVRCLKRVEELFERLHPEALVLETFERRNARGADRIVRLCRALTAFAVDQGVEVAVYGRRDVRKCFESVGARTRHEIAEAVARHLPALAHKLPPKRRAWMSDDKRMSVFCAAALVLTHYRFNAQLFFDGLKDQGRTDP